CAFGSVCNLHAPLPPPCFDLKTLDELHPRLRPGDILLMRTERKLTSTLLPGFWIHSAVYLGQPQDFERMGLADRPELRSEQVNIHSGARYGWVVHAMSPKVIIWPLEKCLEVDHMIALRPALALQGADGRPHLIPDSSALEHLRAIQNGMRPSRDLRG